MVCNILLLGQTGVGKSSLLNYLAGEVLAESGISSGTGGVTRGIHKYKVTLNGQSCLVSDSEGLELGHEKEWRKLVDKEIFPAKGHDKLSAWYHIVIFCVGANSSRIQDFELELIKKITENKYGVIIALTKADLATEEELSSITEEIKAHLEDDSPLTFVPVCSKQRRGNSLEGKEEICEAVVNSWERTLLNRLPEHLYSSVYDSLSNWYDQTSLWLSEQKIGLFNKSKNDVLKELNAKVKNISEKINGRIKAKQKTAFKEIGGITDAIGQAIDFKSAISEYPSLSPRIERLESSFVFNESTGLNVALGAGLATLSFFFPVVGQLAAIGYAVTHSLLKTSPIEELRSALDYQYRTLVKSYKERELMFEYVLADMLGYYYGTREVAIGALKGFGMEKNSEVFAYKIKEVEAMIAELGIEDGRGEYYLAYYYFSSYSGKANSPTKAKKWLKLAVKHDYEAAIAVNQLGDVFSKMREQEQKEEDEIVNYWYAE